MSWFSDVLTALKLPPKILAGVAIVAGFLVLLSGDWMDKLGLVGFMTVARPYVAIVFLVVASILAIEWLNMAYRACTVKRRKSQFLRRLINRLQELDYQEICILREFVIQGQSTIYLPIDQPVVAGLVQKNILQQVGSFGAKTTGGITFSFKVHDHVSGRLTNKLLQLSEYPTEEDKKRIFQDRPAYVLSVLQYDQWLHSLW